MTQAQVPSAYDQPDWDQCGDEILCPLCDYELRGLSVPRCPECGYEFEWRNLLDPARRLHPYLFEHHPRHKTWSFFKTLWGGLRPRQFWTALLPSQPSRLRRLVAYWIIATAIGFIGSVGLHLSFWLAALLPGKVGAWAASSNFSFLGRLSYDRHFGNALWIDVYPPDVRIQIERFPLNWSSELSFVATAFMLVAVWPWLTLLTLLVFQSSLKRAKLHAVHVLRCVLYSGDVSFWAGLVVIVSLLVASAVPLFARGADLPAYLAIGFGAAGVLSFACLIAALLALSAYRLRIAYRYYLHFQHAGATVLLSQCIVFLVYVIVCLFYGLGYLRPV